MQRIEDGLNAQQRYRMRHPELVRAKQQARDLRRRENRTEQQLAEYQEYQRSWRAANAEKVRAEKRKWATENPERVKASKKASRERNRPYWANYFATHLETRKQALFAGTKARAKRTGIPFDLVFSDIVWNEVCPVLGIPINYELKARKRGDDSPSLDRTRPELGYTKGNVVVMSWRANWIKTNSTIDEVAKLMDYLVKVRSN